ncbi:MAG TPA: hypothetical protein VLH37_00105 [Bacteroidales bacterium]|nr:hypothetical protein [Bacteroidales bacterium]
MKQNFTIETEFEDLQKASEKTGHEKLVVVSESHPDEEADENFNGMLPSYQVIQNIVNYARSLEVLKPATAPPLFFVKN